MTANHGCPGFVGSIASVRQLSLKGLAAFRHNIKKGPCAKAALSPQPPAPSPQSLVTSPPYFLGDTYGDIYDKKI